MFSSLKLAIRQGIIQYNVNENIDVVSPYVGLTIGIVGGILMNLPKTISERSAIKREPTQYAIFGAITTILTGMIGLICHQIVTQIVIVSIPCAIVFAPFYVGYFVYASRWV